MAKDCTKPPNYVLCEKMKAKNWGQYPGDSTCEAHRRAKLKDAKNKKGRQK